MQPPEWWSAASAAENAATRVAAKTVSAGLSAYFATQAGKNMTARRPELLAVYNRGDWSAMFKVCGEDLIDAAFGGLALAHAVSTARGIPADVRSTATRVWARWTIRQAVAAASRTGNMTTRSTR